MNYEGVCFYLSIFLAGGDACVPGQTMVRPGDRTSLKAGGDACAPGQQRTRTVCIENLSICTIAHWIYVHILSISQHCSHNLAVLLQSEIGLMCAN